MKAAQIGGTTWSILRSIHACLSGLNVAYYFPTRTDVLDFSRSRVGPLLDENPFLSRMLADTDTVGLKRIRDAFLYLRGMQSTVGLKSVPADMVVFDELDEATPVAKAMARERLAHSPYKRIIELSNPSLPNYGVDEAYQASDQRHWTMKCPGCGYWVVLEREFPAMLGQEIKVILKRPDGTYYRACPRCSAALDTAAGEWVADYPDRSIHGYLISQLISARVEPGEILREYERTRHPERFFNLKIGVAWVDSSNRLDPATVLALCGQEGMLESSEQPCTMGVDVGRVLHVVVSRAIEDSNRRQIVFIAALQHFHELDLLMKRFRIQLCVIDGAPELHSTRRFAARHRGRVFMNFFNVHQKGADAWDVRQLKVQENRTEALDFSRRIIREKQRVLPRRNRMVEEFARHLCADAKQLVENEETGAQVYRYLKTGENHFDFAFTYDCLAAACVGRIQKRQRVERIRLKPPRQVWLPVTPYELIGSR